MTQAQLKDFRSRNSGSLAPVTPVKELPKFAEALAHFATTPERKEALRKLDNQSDDWRKALGFTITNSTRTT